MMSRTKRLYTAMLAMTPLTLVAMLLTGALANPTVSQSLIQVEAVQVGMGRIMERVYGYGLTTGVLLILFAVTVWWTASYFASWRRETPVEEHPVLLYDPAPIIEMPSEPETAA